MSGVNPSERYHLAAPLPPVGGWRRTLALDRRPGAPGPVVLGFAPAALLEDAARLAALVRDVEAAARIAHANVVPVVGLATVDDQLALVEPYCAGTTLRAILDAAGRLPPELAVRVAVDACAGLGAVHALNPGDGQPLAHGAVCAERLLVSEEGVVRLGGVGTAAGRSAPADVRALAAVLYEALSGEAPAAPAAALDVPGIPAGLALVVDGAIDGEGAFPSAEAFAAALSAAVPPAPAAALAAYAEAVRPADVAPQGSPAAEPAAPAPPRPAPPAPPPVPVRFPTSDLMEVSAELISPPRPAGEPATRAAPVDPWRASGVEPTGPVSGPSETPLSEGATEMPLTDAAITFPAPVLVRGGGARLAGGLLAVLVAGFAVGFVLARRNAPEVVAAPPPPVAARALPAALPALASLPAPAPASVPAPAPPPRAEAAAPARRAEAAPARPGPSLAITANAVAEVLVDGKRAGRAPVTVPVPTGEHEVRLSDPAQGIEARRRVVARSAVTQVRFELARGELRVTAPPDAEIWLDGRRIGAGDTAVSLWEGPHKVEARRGGAKVQKKFEVTAMQTQWTFDVTPTP
jgi:hypothetical protein